MEDQIRELGKACYGNLAACWAGMKEDKKVVEACNKGPSGSCISSDFGTCVLLSLSRGSGLMGFSS